MEFELSDTDLRAAANRIRSIAKGVSQANPFLTWEAAKVYDQVYSIDLGPDLDENSGSYGVGEDLRVPAIMGIHVGMWSPVVAEQVAVLLETISNNSNGILSAADTLAQYILDLEG